MKKEVICLIICALIILSVNASSHEGTADPDTTSPAINIVEIYDAPADYPEGMTFDGTYIWSTSIHDEYIFKHDPQTGKVVDKIPAPGGGAMDLAWDGEHLWNANYGVNKIFQLDTDGNILKEFGSPGEQPMGLTWDGEYLWHTDYTLKKIFKIDTDGNIIKSFDAPGQKPHGLAWDDGYLWNSDAVTYNIYKLDTDGNVLEKYYFPYSYPTGLALQGEFLWMAARDTGKIYKLKVPETKVKTVAEHPWPTFRGNLKNTGLSPYDTSHIDGSIKWKTQIAEGLGLVIESSLSIDKDGNLYFSSHENKIYSIYPNGTIRWEFIAGEPMEVGSPTGPVIKGAHATPAIAEDGTIYARTLSGYLFALTSKGEEIWRYPLYVDADSWSSPVIGPDGTIYVGASNKDDGGRGGRIHAVNPDGTRKWEFKTESDVFPTVAIGEDGTIYSGNGADGKFYAIRPSGKLKWRFQTRKHIESSAAIGSDGTLYFGSWDNNIYAVDPNTGRKKWSYLTGGEGIVASPGIGPDGTIYVSANDGYLYALTPEGELKWKHYFGEYYETSSSATIGADGTIYVGVPGVFGEGESRATFFAFNPDGTIKWSSLRGTPSGSASIGADGTVYIALIGGEIYAFGGEGDGEKFVEEVFTNEKPEFEEAEFIEEPFEEMIVEEPEQESETPEGPKPFIPWGVNPGEWYPSDEDCEQDRKRCDEFFATHPEYDPSRESDGRTFEVLKLPAETKETEDIREIPEDLPEKPKDERSFFTKIFDWFRRLFDGEDYTEYDAPDEIQHTSDNISELPPKKSPEEACLTPEEYEPGEPILSLPFDLEDYYPRNWGIIPFCADPWKSGNIHNAIDFELNKDAKVYAAADGKVVSKSFSDVEGAGEIMQVDGDGYSLDYSGLLNIKLEVGDEMKKGDYIADVYETPYGEYHVHLGIAINGRVECPIKYMDEEFKEALREMFAQAHYLRQDEEPCACNCEQLVLNQ